MSGTVLSSNPTINRGLLSALLPVTFMKDFQIQESEIVCQFSEDYENILPRVQSFLDALGEIAETQFYFEMRTKKIGVLKVYDANPLLLNEYLLYDNKVDCEIKEKVYH